MSLTRRKLTQIVLLSGASYAASSGIFFPKPVESLNLDFLIQDATSRNIFVNLIAYAGVKIIDTIFSPKPVTQKAITVANNSLTQNGFTQSRTEYGEIPNQGMMWGEEKTEFDTPMGFNIPNPGFAIVNTLDYYQEPAIFTASTSVGINTASKVLKQQYRFSVTEISELLLPTQELFEDITTWQGDNDPGIGNNPNVGFTIYRSQGAEITRRYERVSPKLGKITMTIDSPRYKGNITTNVKFLV